MKKRADGVETDKKGWAGRILGMGRLKNKYFFDMGLPVTYINSSFCRDNKDRRMAGMRKENGQYAVQRLVPIAFNMILLLCISSIVLGEMPQRKTSLEREIDCSVIVEDITLTTMIVYIGTNGLHCPDTLIIEDINLRVKRGGCKESPVGCGGYDQRRTGRALLSNTDTLLYNCGGSAFWWIKGTGSSEAFYSAIIDSVSLRRLNDILDAFEMSPASCMPEFRRNELRILEELRNRK